MENENQRFKKDAAKLSEAIKKVATTNQKISELIFLQKGNNYQIIRLQAVEAENTQLKQTVLNLENIGSRLRVQIDNLNVEGDTLIKQIIQIDFLKEKIRLLEEKL